MSTILSLAPQNVWKHFYSLTQIPRPSGHMEKISDDKGGWQKHVRIYTFS
jgi:dipeptidase D